MDTFEFKPTEDFTLAKATQGGDEAQALAGATFEPAAFVEGSGEVQPAEALQVSLEVVVASLPTDVESNPGDLPGKDGPGGPGPGRPFPETQETEIKDIPGVGIVPGMYEAETIIKDLPPGEEEKPIPLHADVADAITEPPSEVIVEGGLPMGSVPGDETTGESEPAASDDAKEWGVVSTTTIRAEAEAESAIPTDLPREGVVIPPTLPGREEGRAIPEVGGVGETPLPEADRVEFKEQPERLDARLPEAQGELAGLEAKEFAGVAPGKGTGGLSDGAEFDGRMGEGSDTGLPGVPFEIPEIDIMSGSDLGKGGTPRLVGNMPGKGGKLDGGSEIPDLGIPDMPTSGGPSSSGSGPAMIGRTGGKADPVEEAAKAAAAAIKVALAPVITTSEDQCGTAADKAVELCKMADSDPDREGNTFISFKCVGATKNSSGKLDYYEYDITANAYTYDITKKRQEPEGDSNPHPYTGGSMGPVLPEKDNDTGRVLPDADLDGFDLPVWSADPDSVDDSGRFYGGIFGGGRVYPDSGGARPIDPVRKTEDEAEAADDAG